MKSIALAGQTHGHVLRELEGEDLIECQVQQIPGEGIRNGPIGREVKIDVGPHGHKGTAVSGDVELIGHTLFNRRDQKRSLSVLNTTT